MSDHDLEAFIDAEIDDPRALPFDEAGFAARIVAQHGKHLRWVEAKRTWMTWSGQKWERDDVHRAEDWALKTADSLGDEADAISQEGGKDAANKVEFIRKVRGMWRSAAKVRNALHLAKSWPGVSVTWDCFDANSWILNTPSGILDLRTGDVTPHDPAALCTKITAAAYTPDAEHPALAEVLQFATAGDQDLQRYIQKAFGYSLCGENPLECLFFVHGVTRSGKTTILEGMKSALGDYAKTADFKSFLDQGNRGGGRHGLARLAGSRLVGSSEVKRGAKLAEDVLKWISGNDVIVDHEVYEKEVEFRPQFTLWLLANDRPRAAADDDAIWARIKVIPFLHSVPKDKRDPYLKAQLLAPEGNVRCGTEEKPAAGPALLAWMVRGCLLWQQEGLEEPQAVQDAIEEYRSSNDPVSQFLAECCDVVEGGEAANNDMRAIYEAWAKAEGMQPVSPRVFKSYMEQANHPQLVVKREGKTTRVWANIIIKDDVAAGYGLQEVTRNHHSSHVRARAQQDFNKTTVTNCNRNPETSTEPDPPESTWLSDDEDAPF